jgi:hypothetical protein
MHLVTVVCIYDCIACYFFGDCHRVGNDYYIRLLQLLNALHLTMVEELIMLDRSFYFIVVMWGAKYRDYFLEYCLPTLLAPGNLPALATKRPSKFLIATTLKDWRELCDTAIFREMQQYVEPIHIDIPPCPPDRSGCQHMNVGHRLACSMAYRDKAFGFVLTPDSMVSDGTLARLQQLAHAGVELVVAAALRFGEEPFFDHLTAMGLIPSQKRSESAAPLIISGQQMASAAVSSFHPETLSYEWDAPFLFATVPAAWWRVPGEDGIVLHSLSWAPLLLDYGAVSEHDTSTLEQWTIDGDYLYKNLGRSTKVYVIQDSDEMFLASWTPMAESASVFRPIRFFQTPFGKAIHRQLKLLQFCSSFYSDTFDPLRRKFFFLPVRWHGRPLNASWSAVEKGATRTLLKSVAPSGKTANSLLFALRTMTWFMRLFVIAIEERKKVFLRIKLALSGDINSLNRLLLNLKFEAYSIVGIDLPAPTPEMQSSDTDCPEAYGSKSVLKDRFADIQRDSG